MSDHQIEPIYLVAKTVINQANQFKNVYILNNVDNIPPQFVPNKPINGQRQINVELEPPPLPYRPIKHASPIRPNRRIQLNRIQFSEFKDQSKELYDNLKEFFMLTPELTFRLVILFMIYISIIYNLYRSLAALYLIESSFRSTYHYLTPSCRTTYSIFMLFNLFVDSYGVYTLLKKNVVHIFFYAVALTGFSFFLLLCFGTLSGLSVLLSLLISSLCYLFTYVEYKQSQSDTLCQHCVHHHVNHV